MLTWQWRRFAELSGDDLYDMLALRAQVFEPVFDSPGGGRVRQDSVMGEVRARGGSVDHRGYVAFKEAQALPVAVVSYRHRPGVCRCCRCAGGA